MKFALSVTLVAVAAVTLLPSCKKWFPDHEKKSVVFQPADNYDEVHIFGNAQYDESHAGAPELVAGTGTSSSVEFGDIYIRAAVKFDMSRIPRSAEIKSAKLVLYSNPTPLNGQGGVANSGSNNSMYIQRISEDWDASQVKWTTQPSATTEGQVAVPHTNQPFLDVTADVTHLVRRMIRQDENHGFLIRLQNEEVYNFRVFASSKYSDASKHPKLVVEYKK